MTRKTMERDARKHFVLQAARRIMTRKGIEDASMEDIAAAADYTRRTLYVYFQSRDEIYLMVLVDDMRRRWTEQQQALAAAGSGLEKIMAWGRSFFDFARANPHSMRLHVYWDYRGIDQKKIGDAVFRDFEDINTEMAEGLRKLFRLGMEDGSLRPDLKVDLCISQYLYTLRSAVSRALSPGYSFTCFEPEEYVDHFLDMFSRSIRCDGGILE